MLQAWLVVYTPLKFYAVSNMLFHKYRGANVAVTNWMSQFLCLSQPSPLWNWLTETRDMPKELGLFYVSFLTVILYIHQEQFIIVQVTIPTPYNKAPSNYMLALKRLSMKLLNIVTLLNFKVVLGDNPTRLKKILSKSTLKETGILLSQLSVHFQKNLSVFISVLVMSLLPD